MDNVLPGLEQMDFLGLQEVFQPQNPDQNPGEQPQAYYDENGVWYDGSQNPYDPYSAGYDPNYDPYGSNHLEEPTQHLQNPYEYGSHENDVLGSDSEQHNYYYQPSARQFIDNEQNFFEAGFQFVMREIGNWWSSAATMAKEVESLGQKWESWRRYFHIFMLHSENEK